MNCELKLKFYSRKISKKQHECGMFRLLCMTFILHLCFSGFCHNVYTQWGSLFSKIS